MSKFFAQLLLSIMVGVGAVVGFRSDVRGEVNKTLREAKVSLQETAKITLDSAGDVKTQVNTAVSLSAKTNANIKASIKGNAKTDAKAKGNLGVQVITTGDLPKDVAPNLALDGALNTNAQGLELDLKNKAKSTLDVGLDIIK